MRHAHRILLLGLLAMTFQSSAALAAVGKILFASGAAFLETPTGQRSEARRGNDIDAGAILVTEEGRMQIRFYDGGLIALQPNTRFRIDEYTLKKQDGRVNGKAAFGLIKGGLRAVTGLVGIHETDTYKVETAVATIGIRGTDFSALYCESDCTAMDGSTLPPGLHVSTQGGVIYVQNSAGTLDVAVGQSAYVPSQTSPPQLQDSPPLLVQPDPTHHDTDYTVGEQTTQDGTPVALLSLPGTLGYAWASDGSSGNGHANAAIGNVARDVNGHVVAFDFPSATFLSASGTLTDTGSNAIGNTSWGRWTGAYQLTVHSAVAGDITYSNDPTGMPYIIGTSTPLADYNSLAATLTYASYNFAGGTAPVDSAGNVGTFNSGTLGISFDSGSISGNFSVTVAGNTYTPNYSGTITAGTTAFSFTNTGVTSCGGYTGTCDIAFSGGVVGSNAAGVVTSYNIAATSSVGAGTPVNVTGTALYSQTYSCAGGC